MRILARHITPSILFVGALIALPAPAVRAQLASSPAFPTFPTLVTSGQGEAKVTPDRASVLVNVQTRAATAAGAASENAQRTRAVIDALHKLGLPKEQISTEGYSVYPEMRYDNTGGFPARNGLRGYEHHSGGDA